MRLIVSICEMTELFLEYDAVLNVSKDAAGLDIKHWVEVCELTADIRMVFESTLDMLTLFVSKILQYSYCSREVCNALLDQLYDTPFDAKAVSAILSWGQQ